MSSSAKPTPAQWAQRLVRQALAVPDTSDFTDAENALVSLVHRVLQRGSDRPIRHALDQLQAQEAYDAADRYPPPGLVDAVGSTAGFRR